MQQWRNALSANASIILYGCNVAAGKSGHQFLTQLNQLTGANIAANSQPTGNSELGGTWDIPQLIPPSPQKPKLALTETTLKTYSHILATANPDTKAVTVNSPSVSIDVLANDTGTRRVSVQSITTAPTNGTATINDWIYAGGLFTTVNGTNRSSIARLNADGTLDTTFNPDMGMNGSVRAIAIDSSGKLVVGGFFTSVNGTNRNRIARLNADGTLDTTFDPGTGMNGGVWSIVLDSSGKPVVGGSFTSVNGTNRNRIGRLNADGSLDTTFNPGMGINDTVFSIVLDSSGKPLVGSLSSTSTANGTSPNRIARLNADGSLDNTFNPGTGINGTVYAIALDSSGKPVVGGISLANGNYIARLNADGSLDTTFDLGTGMNDTVYAIALDSSGKPLVGGEFTTVNGTNRNSIARLNANGSLDTTFNPGTGIDRFVYRIALDSSGKPVVGGDFTSVNGTNRNSIARLNADGSLDTTFNPGTGMNNTVWSIAIDKQSSILYTPNPNFNGADTFQYTATDGVVSTPTTVTVLVNDSPILDNSGTPILNPQNRNDSASTGTLISTIITNLGGTGITDPNATALKGIALTSLDTANGTWQYTIDGGTNWTNAPAVSPTSALLLASNPNTSLRFVPNAGYSGTVSNAITFAAWDQISGSNGTTANYTADRSTNTTSSVFSSATETANITVNPFPTIASVSAATANGTYGIGTNIDITVQFSAIVNVTGTPRLSLAGATPVANYLSGTGTNTLTFSYTIAAGDNTPDLDYLSTMAYLVMTTSTVVPVTT